MRQRVQLAGYNKIFGGDRLACSRHTPGAGLLSRHLRDSCRPHAWLGIELGAELPSLTVTNKVPGRLADRARIRVGDEVIQIENAAMDSADQIVQTVSYHSIRQTIKLLFPRRDENVEIVVKFAEAWAPQDEWCCVLQPG
jgi:S1-C subfamily serine protease